MMIRRAGSATGRVEELRAATVELHEPFAERELKGELRLVMAIRLAGPYRSGCAMHTRRASRGNRLACHSRWWPSHAPLTPLPAEDNGGASQHVSHLVVSSATTQGTLPAKTPMPVHY